MNSFVSRSAQGIEVHALSRPHQKRVNVHVCLVEDLDPDYVTAQAMLPHLLLRGSTAYPSGEAVQEALDGLFGAELTLHARRVGNRFVAEYRLELVHERYLPEPRKLLQEGLELLNELLFNPRLADDGFPPETVAEELEAHRQRIEVCEWDPMAWGTQRLREEMFKGTPLTLPPDGREADLADCTPQLLLERYRMWMRNAQVHVYLVGDYEANDLIEQALLSNHLVRPAVPALAPLLNVPRASEVRRVEEAAEGISLFYTGLRCSPKLMARDYPLAVLLYNLLFVFQHSRMVEEMRHRRQFTYNLGCLLDEGTGLMRVTTELDPEHWQTYAEVFLEIIRSVQTELVGEEEFALLSRVSINNIRRRILGTTWRLVDFHLKMRLLELPWTVESMCERFANATAEELREAAGQICVDTMFVAGEGVPA